MKVAWRVPKAGIVSFWGKLGFIAPAGPQSGGFQNVSGRWIVIQRKQKCKAIYICAETMPQNA
jgi:hypothetical protein